VDGTCADFPGKAPLAIQLVFVGHRLARLIERRLARHDYNHTQAVVVVTLARNPGLMAQDLAGLVKVEPPSITRALHALERRGLVARRPHPNDGRASLLQLTDRGYEAVATITGLMHEVSAEVEEEIPPEQLAALRSALGPMLSRIEHLRGTDV